MGNCQKVYSTLVAESVSPISNNSSNRWRRYIMFSLLKQQQRNIKQTKQL